MDYAWLGPVGELRQVPCPLAGVPVSAARETSSFVALDGSRTDYRAARAHRSWVLSYTWKTPDVVAWLSELASGVVVGDTYLYTSVAARENLAPPQLQSGGSGVVAGRRVLAAGDPEVNTYVVPCRPNTQYTLSALGDGVGSASIAADDPTPFTNSFPDPSFETDAYIPVGAERATGWGPDGNSCLRVPSLSADSSGETIWGISAWGLTPWGM